MKMVMAMMMVIVMVIMMVIMVMMVIIKQVHQSITEYIPGTLDKNDTTLRWLPVFLIFSWLLLTRNKRPLERRSQQYALNKI